MEHFNNPEQITNIPTHKHIYTKRGMGFEPQPNKPHGNEMTTTEGHIKINTLDYMVKCLSVCIDDCLKSIITSHCIKLTKCKTLSH